MNEGQVKEFESPHRLLQDPSSQFSKMVDKTGPAASQKLRAMAQEAHLRRRRGGGSSTRKIKMNQCCCCKRLFRLSTSQATATVCKLKVNLLMFMSIILYNNNFKRVGWCDSVSVRPWNSVFFPRNNIILSLESAWQFQLHQNSFLARI